MQRREVSNELMLQVLEIFTQRLGQRLVDHGSGAFVSKHEGLGIITEEFWELCESAKSDDPLKFVDEAFDVAVACLFSVASMAGIQPVAEVSESATNDDLCTRACETSPDNCDCGQLVSLGTL